MSFLKKLGQILARVVQVAGVASGLMPFLGSKAQAVLTGPVNTAVNDLTAVGGVIVQVETALQGKTGPDKLAIAIPLVANIVRTSELVSGHQVGDEAKFVQGVKEIAQGVVDVLNSLKSDNVKETGDTKPIAASANTPVAVTA